MKTRKTRIALLISICACILVCVILLTKDQKNSNEFEEILEEYHISVTGEDLVLSHVQMRGLLDSVQGKQEEMDIKYRERMEKRGKIVITATEFLELDFYAMSEGEQEAFLAKAKNQTVQVAQNGDAFLITYNPNE